MSWATSDFRRRPDSWRAWHRRLYVRTDEVVAKRPPLIAYDESIISLYRWHMVTPPDTDLYVMQNHLGLIKVGKSGNVERRRKQLALADRCEIATVHIVGRGGHRERLILELLSRHREYGEWFSGDECSRSAVRKLTGMSNHLDWVYPAANGEEIDDWISQLQTLREMESREKLSRRLIRDLRTSAQSGSAPSDHYDFKIWEMIWKYDKGLDPWVTWLDDGQGNAVGLATRYRNDTPQRLPAFTSNVSAALLTWPDDERPDCWTGSAMACCAQGLALRLTRMRERSRSGANLPA